MGTYWNNNSPHQAVMDELAKRVEPPEGFAATLHGEVLRAVRRLYYDYYNNGFANLYMPLYLMWAMLIHQHAEHIDTFADEEDFWGTRDVMEPVIRAGKTEGAFRPRDKDKWEAHLEKMVDAVVRYVDGAETAYEVLRGGDMRTFLEDLDRNRNWRVRMDECTQERLNALLRKLRGSQRYEDRK